MAQQRVKHFVRNMKGRDYVVGDIHGYFNDLQIVLDQVGFEPALDRLFSVGDLVDRGPDSAQCLDWIKKPWFHAVQGNHEDMLITYDPVHTDRNGYRHNGGGWFIDKSVEEQKQYVRLISQLPYLISVDTPQGKVGIVHAEIIGNRWESMVDRVNHPAPSMVETMLHHLLWGRAHYDNQSWQEIEDLHALVCGHTLVPRAEKHGNIFYIDTGGWYRDGHFTLLNLTEMMLIEPQE